ncbi:MULTISPECIES: class I SAM-dependent methyltransferase [Rhizobium]|uniref:Trans-aconitate methyltransferase n=1 Tax=Rhizobium paranaense TaxID=1650438 RepID=A0A7W8XM22_9HYPH|nr:MULTISPECIES: class I SAM-dependent methyltransferase [Rhizobium]MBB5571856.1 trans-aconitate methyltransferase [Rhizobium paranaense]
MEQRFTFDGMAGLYGDARPTYPESMFDDIAAFAGLGSKDAILEIGCGTGQATQTFARRGFSILALEPGKELMGIAQQNLMKFPHIRFAETTFEAWPGKPETFKLVMAAQSFHWVAPDVRFAKTAEQLAPGGTLAVFWKCTHAAGTTARRGIRPPLFAIRAIAFRSTRGSVVSARRAFREVAR